MIAHVLRMLLNEIDETLFCLNLLYVLISAQ